MIEENKKLAVIPVKRAHTDLKQAAAQQQKIKNKISTICPPRVSLVFADEVLPEGVLYNKQQLSGVISRLTKEGVDGLFVPHCDFGSEELAAKLGRKMDVPLLLWGARDPAPDPETGVRPTDTQCGVLATSKVLQKFGIPFSYIINSDLDSTRFQEGFQNFTRVISIIKSIKKLKIAQISNRPQPFFSVSCNESELLEKFGIEIVPFSAAEIIARVKEMVTQESKALHKEKEYIKQRVEVSAMEEKALLKIAALKRVLKKVLSESGCRAAALECWSIFPDMLDIVPCFVVAELTDIGLPVACETDILGAVTSVLLQAADFNQSPTFFADLTIRHPENDNAELLWHCGPFPLSLQAEDESPRLKQGQGQWALKKGPVTIARFDALQGDYSLFSGEARGINGPRTEGTYLWIEVEDWCEWEQKIISGPYIHHVVGLHGSYSRVLSEACRFIPGLQDDALDSFPRSL